MSVSTNRINLQVDAYVRVNVGSGRLKIQPLGGDVHVVLTDNQPSTSNRVYHILHDNQVEDFADHDTNVWMRATTESVQCMCTEWPYGTLSGTNALAGDAWGRQKAIVDYSLLHGVWTFDVPNRIWEEMSVATNGDWTPLTQTGTNVSSVGGMLEVRSGTTANQGGAVTSKRNPRYQPNRGHLYSTATMLPSPDADGIRRWGLFEDGNGVYFELEGDGADHTLYAVRKSNGVVQTRQEVNVPAGFDVSKGHVYDIQYQWRGVGNYRWFIDLQEAYADNILGTLTALSIQNPALSASYESITHTTTEIKIQAGCVDITSEGGVREGRQFASISTGDTLLQIDETGRAVIAIYMPRTLSYDGGTVHNTRDLVLSKLAAWTRDEAATQVYYGRDINVTNLRDNVTWSDFPDSTAKFAIGGELNEGGANLDQHFQTDRGNMQLVLSEWDDIEQKNIVINPDQDAAPFHATPGDIVVICIRSIGGNDLNATTIYLAEEV